MAGELGPHTHSCLQRPCHHSLGRGSHSPWDLLLAKDWVVYIHRFLPPTVLVHFSLYIFIVSCQGELVAIRPFVHSTYTRHEGCRSRAVGRLTTGFDLADQLVLVLGDWWTRGGRNRAKTRQAFVVGWSRGTVWWGGRERSFDHSVAGNWRKRSRVLPGSWDTQNVTHFHISNF